MSAREHVTKQMANGGAVILSAAFSAFLAILVLLLALGYDLVIRDESPRRDCDVVEVGSLNSPRTV